MNEIKVSTNKTRCSPHRHLTFSDIEVGDIFRRGRDIYLKIREYAQYNENEENAINLTDREYLFSHFTYDTEVEGYTESLIVDDCYFTNNKSLYDNAKEEYKKFYEKN